MQYDEFCSFFCLLLLSCLMHCTDTVYIMFKKHVLQMKNDIITALFQLKLELCRDRKRKKKQLKSPHSFEVEEGGQGSDCLKCRWFP